MNTIEELKQKILRCLCNESDKLLSCRAERCDKEFCVEIKRMSKELDALVSAVVDSAPEFKATIWNEKDWEDFVEWKRKMKGQQ